MKTRIAAALAALATAFGYIGGLLGGGGGAGHPFT